MLLKEMYHQGGQLVAQGCLNQAIVKEICGNEKSEGRSEDPKDGKGTPIIFYVVLLEFAAGGKRGAVARGASGDNDRPGFERAAEIDAR